MVSDLGYFRILYPLHDNFADLAIYHAHCCHGEPKVEKP